MSSDRTGIRGRYPSPRPFLNRKRISEIRKSSIGSGAISLRHPWEGNYYHFWIDILGKLALLDQIGIDPEIPFIVGNYALKPPYVDILKKGELARRNWIVGEDNYLELNSCYFCRSLQDIWTRTEYAVGLLELPTREAPSHSHGRMIFVNRMAGIQRSVLNHEDVEATVSAMGFEIVDPGSHPFDAQVEMFSEACCIVGIHGAGLTNIIFRQGLPLKVMELFSPRWKSIVYEELCEAWGYSYRRFACDDDGSPDPRQSSLIVDVDLLRIEIEEFLNSELF